MQNYGPAVQVLYGKQLHPDQLRAALGNTAPTATVPVQESPAPAGVGMAPAQQQRVMVRRVTRRLVGGIAHF
jgi:hypothetical protein